MDIIIIIYFRVLCYLGRDPKIMSYKLLIYNLFWIPKNILLWRYLKDNSRGKFYFHDHENSSPTSHSNFIPDTVHLVTKVQLRSLRVIMPMKRTRLACCVCCTNKSVVGDENMFWKIKLITEYHHHQVELFSDEDEEYHDDDDEGRGGS